MPSLYSLKDSHVIDPAQPCHAQLAYTLHQLYVHSSKCMCAQQEQPVSKGVTVVAMTGTGTLQVATHYNIGLIRCSMPVRLSIPRIALLQLLIHTACVPSLCVLRTRPYVATV